MQKVMLVVDDDLDDCQLLEEVLTELAWDGKAIFCHDSASALEILSSMSQNNRLPSLIILDINLPGMNGIDLLRRIKDLYPDLQVLMYSTTCNSDLIQEVKKYGAIDCLTKASTHAQQLKFGRRLLSLL